MILISNLITRICSVFTVKRILTMMSKPSFLAVLYVTYKSVKMGLKARRLNKFSSGFYTPDRNKFFGNFAEFVATMRKTVADGSISEAFLHWRGEKFQIAAKTNARDIRAWIFKILPWRQLLYVSDPELVHILTNINPAYVTKGGFTEDVLLTDKNGFTNGLVMLEHEAWYQQRKIVSKMFNANQLESYITHMDQSALQFVDILSKCTKFDAEIPFNASRSFIYEILFKCLFGENDCTCQTTSDYDDTITMFGTMGSIINWKVQNLPLLIFVQNVPILGPLVGRFVTKLKEEQVLCKKRDEYMGNIVRKATEDYEVGQSGDDIASVLIKAKMTTSGSTLSAKHIHAHLFTLLFAGHETTLAAVCWCIYYLGERDDCRAKICAEFEELGGRVTRETLQKATYTTAFINEVLRLCHVIDLMVPRKLLRDIQFPDGRVMPAGMQFIVDVGSMHRDPRYNEPLTFNPQRFLETRPEKNTFIPFGAGKRNCVGKNFAMQLIKIALFRISSNLKVENLDNGVCNQMEGVSWRPKSGTLLQRFHLL